MPEKTQVLKSSAPKDLTPEIILKLQKHIFFATKKYGFVFEFEDISQEILCRLLEGSHQKATMEQAVVDYIRATYGRVKSNLTFKALRQYEHFDSQNFGEGMPQKEDNTKKDNDLIQEMASHLFGSRRAIFLLKNKWGMTYNEIGDLFGFSKQRAWQHYCSSIGKLKRKLKKKIE